MSSYNRITNIYVIPPESAAKLIACGLRSLKSFLHYVASAGNRQRLSRKTGISESELLKWAHLADLYRIRGVGSHFLQLLNLAGIRCMEDLRNSDPALLLQKIEQANHSVTPPVVEVLPVSKQVESWVRQAREMDSLVDVALVDTILR